MSEKYKEFFNLTRFIQYENSILDELYKERLPPSHGTLEDILKLPVNEKYEENQRKREEELKTKTENNNLSNDNERSIIHTDE